MSQPTPSGNRPQPLPRQSYRGKGWDIEAIAARRRRRHRPWPHAGVRA